MHGLELEQRVCEYKCVRVYFEQLCNLTRTMQSTDATGTAICSVALMLFVYQDDVPALLSSQLLYLANVVGNPYIHAVNCK